MTTRPPWTAPIEELESCWTNSLFSGTKAWTPTNKLARGKDIPEERELPWTPTCPAVCGDPELRCWDWQPNAGELTGPSIASWVGVPWWIVESRSACLWTESPGWALVRTSRNWWSILGVEETWWSSGHADRPAQENLRGSTSRPSRLVAWCLAFTATKIYWPQ